MKAPSHAASGRAAARLAVVLLVVSAAAAALSGACAADSAAAVEASDGGDDGGSVDRATCPPIEPANGAECLLPEGTTCTFGRCALARCTRGAWQVASNKPPRPLCPEAPPNPEVACPACWSPADTCTWGSLDCSAEDASVNTATASCPAGTWILDIRPCRDGGGPDVQGDGGPDAD